MCAHICVRVRMRVIVCGVGRCCMEKRSAGALQGCILKRPILVNKNSLTVCGPSISLSLFFSSNAVLRCFASTRVQCDASAQYRWNTRLQLCSRQPTVAPRLPHRVHICLCPLGIDTIPTTQNITRGRKEMIKS